jgi:hypothetical protein
MAWYLKSMSRNLLFSAKSRSNKELALSVASSYSDRLTHPRRHIQFLKNVFTLTPKSPNTFYTIAFDLFFSPEPAMIRIPGTPGGLIFC